MNISFISKMSSSKEKNCITNWFKKSETEKDKKIEEEPYYFILTEKDVLRERWPQSYP